VVVEGGGIHQERCKVSGFGGICMALDSCDSDAGCGGAAGSCIYATSKDRPFSAHLVHRNPGTAAQGRGRVGQRTPVACSAG
jgi:hypothetical protein